MRIGLLGGTFGYAHKGHIYISKESIKRLQLDEIWWLICHNNPLKTHEDLVHRVEYAKHVISLFPKIKIVPVKDFRTYNVIVSLKNKFKAYDFVWIMGLDNLLEFHSWDNYHKINKICSIAIFDRNNDIYKGIKSKFAIRFMADFAKDKFKKNGWCCIRAAKCDISSTKLMHKRH